MAAKNPSLDRELDWPDTHRILQRGNPGLFWYMVSAEIAYVPLIDISGQHVITQL